MRQAKFSIDDELRARLKARAAHDDRSESAVVRKALRVHLDALDAADARFTVRVGAEIIRATADGEVLS